MELIDERGRIFGVVNIIDALVVLLVLAVVVAGVALVFGDDAEPASEPEQTTRSLTVSVGQTSGAIASLLSTGDRLALGENATVTDVYLAPARGSDVRAVLQVRVTGEQAGGTVAIDGTPIRAGHTVPIRNVSYELEGTVLSVGSKNATLPVRNRSVVVETQMRRAAVTSLEAGETVRVAGQPVATVSSVAAYPTTNPSVRQVELGVRLRTLALAGEARFGNRPIRLGTTIPLWTDRYDLSGTVIERGSTTPPGKSTTVTAHVVWEPVEPTVADSVHTGATERIHGTTYARVTDRTVQPATTIVTSDDGHVYARDHPRLRNVTLTVALQTRRTGDGFSFHGRPLRTGTTVIFDFGDTTVKATVIELQRDAGGGQGHQQSMEATIPSR